MNNYSSGCEKYTGCRGTEDKMRLDKFLSESTSLTRKEIKKLIKDGAVSVIGSVVKAPETKVSKSVGFLK